MLCAVWHTENGGDSPKVLYEVQAKKLMEIWIGTWPIEPGQSVWIEYRVNSGSWKNIVCNWQYNTYVNSYWRGIIPGLGLQADATVVCRINAKQDKSKIPDREGEQLCLCGPFTFTVCGETCPAPGSPGNAPLWTTGAKKGIRTSCSDRSRVGFTLLRGFIGWDIFPHDWQGEQPGFLIPSLWWQDLQR